MKSPFLKGEVERIERRLQGLAKGGVAVVLAIVLSVFTLRGEAAGNEQATAPGKVRPAVLKKMEEILATADSFRQLSNPNLPPTQLKGGGMVDGGGGGDFVEAEVSYFLTPVAARILSIKNVVRDLDILSEDQIKILEDILPKRQNVQKICVLAVVNPKGDPCGDRPYRIVVDPADWKKKTDAQKREFATRKLLGLIQVTSPEAQTETMKKLDEVLSPKKEVFHRLDVIAGSSNGTATVAMNARGENKAQLTLDRSGPHPAFKLEGAADDRNGTYVINSQSPYLKVNYCEDKTSQMSLLNEYGRSIFYREIKPLIEACEKRVASGKEVKTLWISTKTKLVINCR